MYLICSQVVLFAVIILMYVKLCRVSNKANEAKIQIDDTDHVVFWGERNIKEIVYKLEEQINETDEFLFAEDGFINEMKELSNAFDDTEEILFNPEHGINVRLETFENCLEYNCQRVDKIKKKYNSLVKAVENNLDKTTENIILGNTDKSKKQLKKENKNAKKIDEKDGKESKASSKTRKQ